MAVTLIDLNPDAPHSPEHTHDLVNVAAEAIRALNYATRGDDAFHYPSNVYDLLGALAQLAERLPQLCEQTGQCLEDLRKSGHVGEDEGGPNEGSANLAVMRARDSLRLAGGHAQFLRASLAAAQSTIRALHWKDGADEQPIGEIDT